MIDLTTDQTKSIADDLDCGLKCYVNKITKELKTIPGFEKNSDADEEPLEEIRRELEEDGTDYLVIENMTSNYLFVLIEDFVDTIDDKHLKDQLEYVLRRPKPIRNFKYKIDHSGDYRQKWFNFKSKRYIEWVEDQINRYNEVEKSEKVNS
ncbi:MAG: hypothetical protein COC01_07805 [Bacteroidetes bacterium]|nr:MAG: hypothetical protein COC01_07805 [Bacteroidota bacterium]